MNEELKNTTDNNSRDTSADMTNLFTEVKDKPSEDDVIWKDDIDAMFDQMAKLQVINDERAINFQRNKK